jgi:ribosome-associated translation inhibitor RaiA
MQAYVEERLRSALLRCSERIYRIRVTLGDVNGPRGGDDKRCQIHVDLGRLPGVVAENKDADLYAAISRSTLRAARAVKRRLSRALTRERGLAKSPWSHDWYGEDARNEATPPAASGPRSVLRWKS